MRGKGASSLAEQLAQAKQQLRGILQDPLKMRAGVLVCLWLLGYGLVFHPLEARVASAKRLLLREKARAAVAQEIGQLKQEVKLCRERVMRCDQFNEWSQCVIDRTRAAGLVVRNMEIREIRKLDPYHVVAMRLELEGTYDQALVFLKWTEDPARTNRIDLVRLKRESDYLYACLELSGLVEKVGKEDKPGKSVNPKGPVEPAKMEKQDAGAV
jgi:hypothetical protein